jgi:L-lactate dehydrogenase complex protein LldG
LPEFTGWGYSKNFPSPARQTFHQRWADLDKNIAQIVPATKENEVERNLSELSTNKPESESNLVSQFAEVLSSIGGSFKLCPSQDLGSQILELIHANNADEILSWEDRHFPPGLLDFIRQEGIRVKQDLDASIRIGLTSADAAIAETGTLVLPGGPGKSNYPSLTTEIHLVVLRARDIYRRLGDVLGLSELRTSSIVALISGPSRTADIELTLTIGVHGPREVHVLCYED